MLELPQDRSCAVCWHGIRHPCNGTRKPPVGGWYVCKDVCMHREREVGGGERYSCFVSLTLSVCRSVCEPSRGLLPVWFVPGIYFPKHLGDVCCCFWLLTLILPQPHYLSRTFCSVYVDTSSLYINAYSVTLAAGVSVCEESLAKTSLLCVLLLLLLSWCLLGATSHYY